MRSPRLAKLLGAVVGVTVGCLLGMFPLLWMDLPISGHHASSKQAKQAEEDAVKKALVAS